MKKMLQREEAAWHEVGHAVMAIANGAVVHEIKINKRGLHGNTAYSVPCHMNGETLDKITIAGHVFQVVFCGRDLQNTAMDMVCEGCHDSTSDGGLLGLTKATDVELALDSLSEAVSYTKGMLQGALLDFVSKLIGALLENFQLSYNDIEKIGQETGFTQLKANHVRMYGF